MADWLLQCCHADPVTQGTRENIRAGNTDLQLCPFGRWFHGIRRKVQANSGALIAGERAEGDTRVSRVQADGVRTALGHFWPRTAQVVSRMSMGFAIIRDFSSTLGNRSRMHF